MTYPDLVPAISGFMDWLFIGAFIGGVPFGLTDAISWRRPFLHTGRI
jgi:hypothetical protein